MPFFLSLNRVKLIMLFTIALLTALTQITLYAKEAVSELASKKIAPVLVEYAWVRATNAGQSVGAAYMTLTSKQALDLIAVKSDLTDAVEIHSMSMQNGVMKMRKLNVLSLKANEPYQLTPGGFHLMLFDLKKPLLVGEKVHFDLYFKSSGKSNDNQSFALGLEVMVKESDKAVSEHHHTH